MEVLKQFNPFGANRRWMEDVALNDFLAPLPSGEGIDVLSPHFSALPPPPVPPMELKLTYPEGSDEAILMAAIDKRDKNALERALGVLVKLCRRVENAQGVPGVSVDLINAISRLQSVSVSDKRIQIAANNALARLVTNADSTNTVVRILLEDERNSRSGPLQAVVDSVSNSIGDIQVVTSGVKTLDIICRKVEDTVKSHSSRISWDRVSQLVRRVQRQYNQVELNGLCSAVLNRVGTDTIDDPLARPLFMLGCDGTSILSECVPPTPGLDEALWTPWANESNGPRDSDMLCSPEDKAKAAADEARYSMNGRVGPGGVSMGMSISLSGSRDTITMTTSEPGKPLPPGTVSGLPSSMQQTLAMAGMSGAGSINVKDLQLPKPDPTKKKKKRKRDPNTPRGPRSAYVFFSQMMCEDVRRENPDATPAELSKIMGIRWQQIAEEDRKLYNELAEKDKDRYNKEMEDFRYKRLCSFA
eukprot:GFYU01007930.1.p1 GENE.GFYU01007930.1~~GFYU01007930.1.p1  ORF type:complete len:473 (-),score=154.43 GFYU01007930.1:49-1467(-)